MRFHLTATCVLLACAPARAQVFADFETKQGGADFGEFTVVLDHEFSPFTVANFIRLAEGLVPWFDPENGEIRTGPFYDGLAFDGLTDNWEVTSGSPSNDQSGGPGYIFRDDFRSNANGSAQFAIYMDNDGPNTNGSRFFINLTAALNPDRQSGQYTRFGQVLPLNQSGGNGRAVVAALSLSAPGFVTIDEVTMRYVGAAAQDFRVAVEDPNHPYLTTLPTPQPAVFTFRKTADSLFLDWDEMPGSIAQLWSSLDLQEWIGPFPVRNVPGDDQFGFDLTPTLELAPTAFFRGGVVRYPDWPATERPLAGAAIQTMFFDPAIGTLTSTYTFDPTGLAGNYSSPFGNGTFDVTASEILGPFSFSLELTPTSGNQPAYRFTHHYDLAWSSPIPSIALPLTANPSRLTGENLANPGTPLQGGQWTYLPAP